MREDIEGDFLNICMYVCMLLNNGSSKDVGHFLSKIITLTKQVSHSTLVFDNRSDIFFKISSVVGIGSCSILF